MIWLDAQLPPALAPWIEKEFNIQTKALRDLGLRDAKDMEIFNKAHQVNAIIMTKDNDFAELHFRFGAPPKIILLRCGNLTNQNLQHFLSKRFSAAIQLLEKENIVELV